MPRPQRPDWFACLDGTRHAACDECVYQHAPELIPVRGAADDLFDVLEEKRRARGEALEPPGTEPPL
jgi:hypothetical protein